MCLPANAISRLSPRALVSSIPRRLQKLAARRVAARRHMATGAQPCSPSSNRERKRGSALRSNAMIAALVHISAATLALSSPQLRWAPCVLRLNASPPYELRLDVRPAATMRLGQVARLASPLCPAGPFLQLLLAPAQPPQSPSHRFCPFDVGARPGAGGILSLPDQR